MTINKFIEKLNQMGVSGDDPLRVRAFGGMRHGKEISDVKPGIDWDHGAVIIHTEVPLSVMKVGDDSTKNTEDLLKRFGWNPEESTLEVWLETNMLLARQAREAAKEKQ